MSIYTCSLCGYNTKTKGNINKHVKDTIKCKGANVDIEEVEVVCKICNKTFENDAYLKQHTKKCFEKKTVSVNNYENAEEFKERINLLSQLISIQNLKIETVVKHNEELLKRIEKLEKLEKAKSEEYEDLNNPDESCCEYYINDGPFITSHKQVCDYYAYENGDIKSHMKINVVCDGRPINGAVMSISQITANGKVYKFNPKEKQKNQGLVGELQIDNTKNCESIARFIHKTNEKLCCENHKDYFRKFKE